MTERPANRSIPHFTGIGVAVLALGVLLVWYVLRNPDSAGRAVTPEAHRATQSTIDRDAKPATPTSQLTPAAAEAIAPGARSELEVPQLSIRVEDLQAQVIADAEIEWVIPPKTDYSGLHTWRLRDWDAFDAAAVVSHTGSDGVARFTSAPDAAKRLDSVLWVTHAGFQAEPVRIEHETLATASDRRVQLRPSPPVIVHVVNGADEAVVGARVDWMGGSTLPLPPPGHWLRGATLSFHRSALTDVAGNCSFLPLQGTHYVWASNAELASTVLKTADVASSPIRIVLEPTFTAGGSVRFEQGATYDPAIQVTCYIVQNGVKDAIHQVAVTPDGAWGPVQLPLPTQADFRFLLTGGDVIRVNQERSHPHAGERVTVDFIARPGLALTVRVRDEENAPIHGAWVTAFWQDREETGTGNAFSNPDGIARVAGLAAKSMNVSVTMRGFVSYAGAPFMFSSETEQPLVITLAKAGRVVGKVTRGGKPEHNFSVTLWPAAQRYNYNTTAFANATDGEFAIDEAPLGDVSIFATSTECPRGEVKVLHVDATQDARVELDLPESILGRGRVVDAATGEGISSARLRLYSSWRGDFIGWFGAFRSVNADGTFEIKGFSPGDSRFVVNADGYAGYLGQTTGAVGRDLDLGLIALQRAQTLEVRLEPPGSRDFSSWQVNAEGNETYPLQPFNREGISRFENVGPGIYFICVFTPDGRARATELYLEPGREWVVRFPVDGGRVLDVSVTGADGRTAEEIGATEVIVTHASAEGRCVLRRQSLDVHGRATFDALPAGVVTVEALDKNGDSLGLTVTRLETAENSVELRLGAHDLTVLVVDVHGRPLDGTGLQLRAPQLGFAWWQHGVTDAHGEHRFPSLGMPSVLINLNHPTLGMRADVEVDLERHSRDKPVVLTLDAHEHVRIRCIDGDTPVPALQVRYFAERCEFCIGSFVTGMDGRAESGPVAHGSFRFSIEQPGVWPASAVIDSRADEAANDVQVMRVGGLELIATRVSGEPLAGAVIELINEQMHTSVSSWIESGLVKRPSNGLATGTDGRLLVDGLPRGSYRWTLRGPGGESGSGSVQVPPRDVAHVEVSAKP